jgi:DNA polymerase-3 subunit delta
VILKSYIVEQNIDILKKYQATLIYGINKGLKGDIKEAIKNQNEDCEIMTFFESDITKNNFLYENIANQSLFNNKKVIFVQEATDKIIEQIKQCLEKTNESIQIYIFSEILEKKSKLRSFFEKEIKLASFPCYEDNERTLLNYIEKNLKGCKGLTGEIINLIINNSNMDRGIIKNEIVKIKDFFLDKRITKDEILEILNIKNDSGFDEIRDKALSGNKYKINKLLSETEILNEEVFSYLNSLNYRVTRLYEIIKLCEENKNNYEQIMASLKPPIFWKDKPVILQQLQKWSKKKLEEMITKIAETECLMKKNSYVRNDIIIKNLIINLTNKAAATS